MRKRLERGAVCAAALLCAAWDPLWRTQPDIDDGIEAYREKKWDEALAAFERAAKEIPDTPELHLGRGDVHCQKALVLEAPQRYEELVKARDEFQRSLGFDAPQKRAAAYYNLGTATAQTAMLEQKMVKGQVQPQPREERIGLLRTAIDGFRKALDLVSEDMDAKFNLEVAQRLLEQLEEEKKKEEEQRKKEEQQKKDEQKKDQQKKDQQKKDQQQKQDQQKDGQQEKQNQQKNGQPEKQNQQKDDKQEKQNQQRKQDEEKKQEQERREKEQQKQQQQQSAAKEEPRKPKEVPLDLAPLEALKNSEKPLQLYRLMMDPRKRIPVKKDW